MTSYPTLQEANAARHKEWNPDDTISGSYRSNELAGEIGEGIEEVLNLLGLSAAMVVAGAGTANIVKKLEREKLGMVGSRSSPAALGKELGDIVICCHLVAMHFGIDLDQGTKQKFNETSEKYGLATRWK